MIDDDSFNRVGALGCKSQGRLGRWQRTYRDPTRGSATRAQTGVAQIDVITNDKRFRKELELPRPNPCTPRMILRNANLDYFRTYKFMTKFLFQTLASLLFLAVSPTAYGKVAARRHLVPNRLPRTT